MLPRIVHELNDYKKILLVYGRKAVKQNGIYDKVIRCLQENRVAYCEFPGIIPNPEYEQLTDAVAYSREQNADFILGLGGGSVVDAAKFIALAHNESADLWDIITGRESLGGIPLPLGAVITVPGSGSEMNNALVVSRRKLKIKIPFSHYSLYPAFSLLDPEFSFSLSAKQTALGCVDIFVHVLEQYMADRGYAPLQKRQAESILMTLIETAPLLLKNPHDYNMRAAVMWCSAQALNGTLSRGVSADWTTHEIGHILTALYDIPHAQSLTLVIGGLYRHVSKRILKQLARFGENIWHISGNDAEAAAAGAIRATENFFQELGLSTRFHHIGLDGKEVADEVCEWLNKRNINTLGVEGRITVNDVGKILKDMS